MGLDTNFANLLAAENNAKQIKPTDSKPMPPDQDSVDSFLKEMDGAQSEEAGRRPGAEQNAATSGALGGTPGKTMDDAQSEAMGRGLVTEQNDVPGRESGKATGGTSDETRDDALNDLLRQNESRPSADSMLESLFGNRMLNAGQQNVGMTQVNAAQGASDPAFQRTAELVDKLVDRILVSEPGKSGTEVRLTVSDKILPGTEISIIKALDGQLNVKILSSDPASFQTLVAAQGSLRSALEREGGNVRVDVNMSGETDAQENDSRRQSRGYLAYQTDEDDK